MVKFFKRELLLLGKAMKLSSFKFDGNKLYAFLLLSYLVLSFSPRSIFSLLFLVLEGWAGFVCLLRGRGRVHMPWLTFSHHPLDTQVASSFIIFSINLLFLSLSFLFSLCCSLITSLLNITGLNSKN